MKTLIFILLLVGCKQTKEQQASSLDSVSQETLKDGGILISAGGVGSNEISISQNPIRDDIYFCGIEVAGRSDPFLILEAEILNKVDVQASKKSSQWFYWVKERLFKNKESGSHEKAYFIFDQKSYNQFKNLTQEQKADVKSLQISHTTLSLADLGLNCNVKDGVLARISMVVDIQVHKSN